MKTVNLGQKAKSLTAHEVPVSGKKKRSPKEERLRKDKRDRIRKARKKQEAAESTGNKKSKELAVVQTTKEISKEERRQMKKILARTRKLKGTFKDNIPRIFELIDGGDVPTAAAVIQKGFIRMITELVPVMENQVHKRPGQSTVYSLNSLISQSREILEDMRAEKDQGALASKVCNDILFGAFQSIGFNLATSLYQLREELKPHVRDTDMTLFENKVNMAAKDIASYVEGMFAQTKEKVAGALITEE